MSRPSPRNHTADQILALADSAQKAADNLRATGESMQALPDTGSLQVLESGSINKAMRVVVKFSMQAFLSLQDIRIGNPPEPSDTERPKSNKSGQQRAGKRTQKDKSKSTQVVDK